MQAIWDGIREAMGHVLAFFYAIVPNAGFAIIMLTVCVRLILFPLTAKQAKSMIAMQRAQPEIKKLQAKYKNDKQKLNEEMMKFYKENSINPLGGCLPLLAQTPIFIALYQTLRQIQHFIPQNSKMFDAICQSTTAAKCTKPVLDFFGMNLAQTASNAPKGFGNALPYYVLVGLVVISAFLQQRQTMRGQTTPNPQMQVIGKVMPVVFGFISINIPAGVVLYFLTSNIWQIGQQEVVFRTIGTAAGPPKGKDKGGGQKGSGKGLDDGGGSDAIEAKSSESPAPKPATGGVKGLFKSLSPGAAAVDDSAPSGNGKPQPKPAGAKSTGAKNAGAKSTGSKSTGAKSAPAKSTPTKKTGNGTGSGSGTAASTPARRKNNRKRTR
ncbi:MAG: membrane protein insertase YidC [Acidimicrobiia bacterium]